MITVCARQSNPGPAHPYGANAAPKKIRGPNVIPTPIRIPGRGRTYTTRGSYTGT